MSYEFPSEHLGELRPPGVNTTQAPSFASIVGGRFVGPAMPSTGTGLFRLASSNIQQSVPRFIGSSPGPSTFIPNVPITAVTPAPVPIVTTVSSDVPYPGRIDYSGAPMPRTVEATPLPAGDEVTSAGMAPASAPAAALPPWLPMLALAAGGFLLFGAMRKRARA